MSQVIKLHDMPKKNPGTPIENVYGVGDILVVEAGELTNCGLMPHLETIGLDREARSIWLSHPNLRAAVDQLFGWISDQWPSRHDEKGVSAGYRAVEEAMNQVRLGLAVNETDTTQVVTSFYKGLIGVADDLANFTAWGCSNGRGLRAWRPFEDGRLADWVRSAGFESVAFSRKDRVDMIDRDGIAWKIRSSITTTRDLGIIHRYGV